MTKKIIRLTESDLVKIVNRVINEQDIREETKFKLAIQDFLNQKIKANLDVDGLMGDKTSEAISKYQQLIGADPDGIWGQKTWNKMPENDKKLFKNLMAKRGGLIDKFLNFIGI